MGKITKKEPKKLLKMEDLHDFKDRMSFVVQLYFTNKADAAEQLELSQQMISGLTNGKTKPSFDTILQIHKIIPDLNLHWLLLGEGNMSQSLQTNKQADTNTQIIEEPYLSYGQAIDYTDSLEDFLDMEANPYLKKMRMEAEYKKTKAENIELKIKLEFAQELIDKALASNKRILHP